MWRVSSDGRCSESPVSHSLFLDITGLIDDIDIGGGDPTPLVHNTCFFPLYTTPSLLPCT
jgi:hypothetical protein